MEWKWKNGKYVTKQFLCICKYNKHNFKVFLIQLNFITFL